VWRKTSNEPHAPDCRTQWLCSKVPAAQMCDRPLSGAGRRAAGRVPRGERGHVGAGAVAVPGGCRRGRGGPGSGAGEAHPVSNLWQYQAGAHANQVDLDLVLGEAMAYPTRGPSSTHALDLGLMQGSLACGSASGHACPVAHATMRAYPAQTYPGPCPPAHNKSLRETSLAPTVCLLSTASPLPLSS